MKTTIDRAGRLVVPERIRDAAGIVPGAELQIRFADGRIEIEPAPLEVRLVKRGSLTVAVPRKRVPALTAEAVRQTIDQLRRRGADESGGAPTSSTRAAWSRRFVNGTAITSSREGKSSVAPLPVKR